MAEAHANLANALQQLGNFDMSIIYYQVLPRVLAVAPSDQAFERSVDPCLVSVGIEVIVIIRFGTCTLG